MKNLINLLVLLITNVIFSQVPPELISYRATALDTGGDIISNQTIGIKISILDAVYSTVLIESHSQTTDVNGQYNLNIGGGTFISGTEFSDIDWGGGNRHLKVEIDPNGGTNYTIDVGTTQLLSVPYALLAKNVVNNNSIEITNTINDLLINVVPVNSKIVYVKGYYSEGDGGEGMFIFNSTSNLPDNLGTIFKSNSTTTGRWIRQYSGYINVGYFGIKRDWLPSGFSNSDRIQNIIDYVSDNNIYNKLSDMTIFFPNGEYFIDKPLILKNKVKILGGAATLFTAFTINGSYDYMIKMGVGPIVGCEINTIQINLNNNPNIGGIHLKAVGNPTGGIWSSVFKNISMGHLKGNGIFLEGGDVNSNFNLPNQFLTFENVRVQRNDDNYNSLKITGEQGQITFLNCTFDGTNNKGINVYIGKLNVADVGGSGNAVISFINSTIQDSEYGTLIDHSENITFDNCWFERLDIGLEIRNSKGINVFNNRFADAAGYGSLEYTLIPPGTGRCISVENSFINVSHNFVAVTDSNSLAAKNEAFILGIGNNNTINVRDNSFSNPILSETVGIMQTINIVSSIINVDSKKLIFINSTGTINRINSTVNAGETLFIRANGGSITFLPMNPTNETTGKNIFLNGRSSLILANGQAATFIKIDNAIGNEKSSYQLVSISN